MPEHSTAPTQQQSAARATPARGPGAAVPPQVARVLELQRTAGNAAVVQMLARRDESAAAKLIEASDHWYGLDYTKLGAELLGLLPKDAALVNEVFDKVSWSKRDDVAEALCNAASDDQLRTIAKDPGGRDALRRVVRELLAGWTTDNENKQLRRVMAIISEQAPLVDAPGGAKTLEIEVVTFDKGGKVMDFLGQKVAPILWGGKQFGEGARGHTAILVGGLAYSYEGSGWRVGMTAPEYMKSATLHRDATSQVLLLPIEDARKIQAHLNRVANTGIYLLGGEVCSDATGTALENALGKLVKDANPQHMKNQLEASGKVAFHRYYPQGGDGRPSRQY